MEVVLKNKVIAIIWMIILFTPKGIFSENYTEVEFDTKMENNNSSYILINVKDAKNIYAASIDFTYNPDLVKVKSIEGGDMLKTSENSIIELGGETEKDGNKASYQFTFTGKVKGISGSGNICKIEVEYLSYDKYEVNDSNMKVKLAGISDKYEIEEINYRISGSNTQNNIISEDDISDIDKILEKVDAEVEILDNSDTSNKNEKHDKNKLENVETEVETLKNSDTSNKNGSNDNNKLENVGEDEDEEINKSDSVNVSNKENLNFKNSKLNIYIIGSIVLILIVGIILSKKFRF